MATESRTKFSIFFILFSQKAKEDYDPRPHKQLLQKAFVLINCELGHETEVIKQLKNIQGIKEAHGTFGAYDIVAEIESKPESLAQAVTNQIRKLSHIRSTNTLVEIGEFFGGQQEDLVPDVIPEEKKPLEPPDTEEYEDEEDDDDYDDDDDYEEK